MVNRTQALVLGFFLLAWTSLLVILVAASEVYDQALGLPTGDRTAELAFLAALSGFIALLALGVVRRWRWTFWLVLVAFLFGVLRVPVAILQLTGVLAADGPTWYVVFQGLLGVVQFAIGLALVSGERCEQPSQLRHAGVGQQALSLSFSGALPSARQRTIASPAAQDDVGTVKTRARSGARSGSVSAMISSPARSLVELWTGTSWPPRITRLIHTSSPTARSPMVHPSAGEPAATRWRRSPRGSLRNRTPRLHGSGSTVRIGTPSLAATAGTRLPWTMTEKATTTKMTAYSRVASGSPAVSRKVPSRIGTAPFSPAHNTNNRSPHASRTGSSSRPTSSGRTTNVSSTASVRPMPHAPPSGRVCRPTVRPSTMNATISARLASAPWNRSMSPL